MNEQYQFTMCRKCGATHSKSYQHEQEESWLGAFTAGLFSLTIIVIIAVIVFLGFTV